MALRIEFQERVLDLSAEEIEKYERMGMTVPKADYWYRRISIRLSDIFAPKECSVDDKDHCAIEFYDCTTKPDLVVKGSYDDISILIEDRERQEEQEEYEREILRNQEEEN